MNFAHRLREFFQTPGWLDKEARRWSAAHYAGADREIARRVISIVVIQLGVSFGQLTPDSKIVDDLGVTDLDGVELVMALEEEFHTKISDDDARKISTIGMLIRYFTK
jgi:acyl carrier protein